MSIKQGLLKFRKACMPQRAPDKLSKRFHLLIDSIQSLSFFTKKIHLGTIYPHPDKALTFQHKT